uniref:Uncharacterized protein n=1 Tax=Pyrodinium bahamense TaxID=73915 RepID=A0A7S0FH15_9DINO|mmetsp:Transcript_30102/g.83034  ORF Transcript_30102/g.83034 Transcript_30102/m.83034 type:complete len:144 (+) Transcript_30102:96-527(+)
MAAACEITVVSASGDELLPPVQGPVPTSVLKEQVRRPGFTVRLLHGNHELVDGDEVGGARRVTVTAVFQDVLEKVKAICAGGVTIMQCCQECERLCYDAQTDEFYIEFSYAVNGWGSGQRRVSAASALATLEQIPQYAKRLRE